MTDYIDQILQHEDFREDQHWRRLNLESAETLVRVGEQSNNIYIVESGELAVLGKITLEGDRQVSPGVCELGPGDVVGELALFDEQPRSATVQANTAATVIEVDGAGLMTFLEKHPDIGFAFLRHLMGVTVRRLRATNQKVFSLLAWGIKAHDIDKHL